MAEYHFLRSEDQNPSNPIFAQQNEDAERRAKECKTAEMPSLDHLHYTDYDTVYEPSDDTYLLIDAIGREMDGLEQGGGQTIARRTLEIGCGTGVPTIYLARRLRGLAGLQGSPADGQTNGQMDGQTNGQMDDQTNGQMDDQTNVQMDGQTNGQMDGQTNGQMDGQTDLQHFLTDINPRAVAIAQSTAAANCIPLTSIHALQCDLASDLLPSLRGKVDIVLFNPPYVPTPEAEVGSSGIEASWAGGKHGRAVLDRVLPQIAQLLRVPTGVAFLVVVDDNYPQQIARWIKKDFALEAVPFLRRRARNEFLTVLKITFMNS